MLTDSTSTTDINISENQTFDNKDSKSPLLPRKAWNSNLAFLRVVFRVKKTLDEMEFAEDVKLN